MSMLRKLDILVLISVLITMSWALISISGSGHANEKEVEYFLFSYISIMMVLCPFIITTFLAKKTSGKKQRIFAGLSNSFWVTTTLYWVMWKLNVGNDWIALLLFILLTVLFAVKNTETAFSSGYLYGFWVLMWVHYFMSGSFPTTEEKAYVIFSLQGVRTVFSYFWVMLLAGLIISRPKLLPSVSLEIQRKNKPKKSDNYIGRKTTKKEKKEKKVVKPVQPEDKPYTKPKVTKDSDKDMFTEVKKLIRNEINKR